MLLSFRLFQPIDRSSGRIGRAKPRAHGSLSNGMKQQVLDWLAEVESGAECSQGLEAVSTAVQQDPAALAALVREGGLSHVVALQEKESASAAVATI